MTLAEEVLALSQIVVTILPGTDRHTVAALSSTSRAALHAVAPVLETLLSTFPHASFTYRKLDPEKPSVELMAFLKRGQPSAGIFQGVLQARGGVALGSLPESISCSMEVPLSSLIQHRRGSAIGILNGQVYVCGGAEEDDMESECTEIWDPETETWAEVRTARSQASEVWDPETERWKELPRPSPKVCSLVWIIGGSILHQLCTLDPLAMRTAQLRGGGGRTAEEPTRPFEYMMCAARCRGGLTFVERFDASTGSWQQLAPLNQPRAHAVAAGIGGILYVCGGIGPDGAALRSAERWDSSKGSWEMLAPMRCARSWPAAKICRGSLLVYGGWDALGSPLDTAELFDPVSACWRSVALHDVCRF
eukprot:TRINITY_DN61886_c0_g1_i1.p1 TRINITY_DN61886_c0_g1~~TRINITY_DN61886_c0_g1_i1.p1  ORF type:complete len:364 (-),score=47.72 TRINITY_DN61886_c0_g1_i1:137-1228(-)